MRWNGFLYRLSKSVHAGQFVLKGAMLFAIWNPRSHRPTRDLDMLAYGDDSEERLMRIFCEICQTQVSEDGLRFDVESLRVSAIREGQEYQGKHIEMTAYLGKSRIKVRVDIGFGDVITPQAKEISYPRLCKRFARFFCPFFKRSRSTQRSTVNGIRAGRGDDERQRSVLTRT